MRLKTKKKPVKPVNTSALRTMLSESAFARVRLKCLATRAGSGRSRRRGIFMGVEGGCVVMNKGLFTSQTDNWETPQVFFEKLNDEFHFDLDVCASLDNAKCKKFYTKEQDGLNQEWTGVCWMNPPYGNEIGKWLKKAYESSINGAIVVCLIPARTDTAWWHDYVMKGKIRFIRGRLKFGGNKNSAPFPSAIVVFRGKEGAE